MTRASKINTPNAQWRKAEAKARREKLEKAFEWQLKAAKINYETQFMWHPQRGWRADFYISSGGPTNWVDILVEIEGGNWIQGRHTRGKGFEVDVEKYNEAALLNYIVLRGTAKHVKSGQLLNWVERALMALGRVKT